MLGRCAGAGGDAPRGFDGFPRNESMATRILYVVGMAAFFSAGITQIMMPPFFFASDPFDVEGVASLILLLVLLVSALVYLLCRSYKLVTRRREITCLAVALALDTLVQGLLLSGVVGPDAFGTIRWLYLVGLAPALVLLTAVWAGVCDFFDGRELRILIPLAMLLSVCFGVGFRMAGESLELGAGAAQSFFPLISGFLGGCLLERLSSLSRKESDSRGVEFEEFHPTGEERGSLSLLVALVGLWAFLFGTSVFVGYYSQGFKLDALQGEAHIVTVFLLACGIILIARLAEKHLMRFQVSIMLFLSLCLLALYSTALLGVSHTSLAKNLLLPARACALFFLWLILEEYCRERDVPFASLAVMMFFPSIVAVKCATIVSWDLMRGLAIAGTEAQWVLAATCLVTAFLLTVSAFFVVRYGWGGESGHRIAGIRVHAREALGFSDGDGPCDVPQGGASLDGAHAEICALELVRIRYGLTNREYDVLRLTMQGHTQKGMADELYLSVNSVSTYVKALHAKLDVHSRQETVDLVRSLESDGQAFPATMPSE